MHRRFVFVVLTVAGCSALTSLDDLRDGGTDVPMDASGPDGGTAFCAPYADASLVFCQSFDSVTSAASLELALAGGADAGVDDADFTSSPSSLLSSIPISDASLISACVSHQTGVAASSVTLDFQLKIVSMAYETSAVALIRAQPASGHRTLSFVLSAGGFIIQESFPGSDGGGVLLGHPPISYVWDQQWHAIHVAIDYDGKTDTVVIDGTTYEANFLLSSAWTKGDVEIQVGLAYMGVSTQSWMLRIDDVLAKLTL